MMKRSFSSIQLNSIGEMLAQGCAALRESRRLCYHSGPQSRGKKRNLQRRKSNHRQEGFFLNLGNNITVGTQKRGDGDATSNISRDSGIAVGVDNGQLQKSGSSSSIIPGEISSVFVETEKEYASLLSRDANDVMESIEKSSAQGGGEEAELLRSMGILTPDELARAVSNNQGSAISSLALEGLWLFSKQQVPALLETLAKNEGNGVVVVPRDVIESQKSLEKSLRLIEVFSKLNNYGSRYVNAAPPALIYHLLIHVVPSLETLRRRIEPRVKLAGKEGNNDEVAALREYCSATVKLRLAVTERLLKVKDLLSVNELFTIIAALHLSGDNAGSSEGSLVLKSRSLLSDKVLGELSGELFKQLEKGGEGGGAQTVELPELKRQSLQSVVYDDKSSSDGGANDTGATMMRISLASIISQKEMPLRLSSSSVFKLVHLHLLPAISVELDRCVAIAERFIPLLVEKAESGKEKEEEEELQKLLLLLPRKAILYDFIRLFRNYSISGAPVASLTKLLYYYLAHFSQGALAGTNGVQHYVLSIEDSLHVLRLLGLPKNHLLKEATAGESAVQRANMLDHDAFLPLSGNKMQKKKELHSEVNEREFILLERMVLEHLCLMLAKTSTGLSKSGETGCTDALVQKDMGNATVAASPPLLLQLLTTLLYLPLNSDSGANDTMTLPQASALRMADKGNAGGVAETWRTAFHLICASLVDSVMAGRAGGGDPLKDESLIPFDESLHVIRGVVAFERRHGGNNNSSAQMDNFLFVKDGGHGMDSFGMVFCLLIKKLLHTRRTLHGHNNSGIVNALFSAIELLFIHCGERFSVMLSGKQRQHVKEVDSLFQITHAEINTLFVYFERHYQDLSNSSFISALHLFNRLSAHLQGNKLVLLDKLGEREKQELVQRFTGVAVSLSPADIVTGLHSFYTSATGSGSALSPFRFDDISFSKVVSLFTYKNYYRRLGPQECSMLLHVIYMQESSSGGDRNNSNLLVKYAVVKQIGYLLREGSIQGGVDMVDHFAFLIAALKENNLFFSFLFSRMCRILLSEIFAGAALERVMPAFEALANEYKTYHSSTGAGAQVRNSSSAFAEISRLLRQRLLYTVEFSEEYNLPKDAGGTLAASQTAMVALNAFSLVDPSDSVLLRFLTHELARLLSQEKNVMAAAVAATADETEGLVVDAVLAKDGTSTPATTGDAEERQPAPGDAAIARARGAETDFNVGISRYLSSGLTPSALAAVLRVLLDDAVRAVANGGDNADGGTHELLLPMVVLILLERADDGSNRIKDLYPTELLLLLPYLLNTFCAIDHINDTHGAAQPGKQSGGSSWMNHQVVLHKLFEVYSECRGLFLFMYGGQQLDQPDSTEASAPASGSSTSDTSAIYHDAELKSAVAATAPIQRSLAAVPVAHFVRTLIALSNAHMQDTPLATALADYIYYGISGSSSSGGGGDGGKKKRVLYVLQEALAPQQLLDLTLALLFQFPPHTTATPANKQKNREYMAPLLDALWQRTDELSTVQIHALLKGLYHYYTQENVDHDFVARLQAQEELLLQKKRDQAAKAATPPPPPPSPPPQEQQEDEEVTLSPDDLFNM